MKRTNTIIKRIIWIQYISPTEVAERSSFIFPKDERAPIQNDPNRWPLKTSYYRIYRMKLYYEYSKACECSCLFLTLTGQSGRFTISSILFIALHFAEMFYRTFWIWYCSESCRCILECSFVLDTMMISVLDCTTVIYSAVFITRELFIFVFCVILEIEYWNFFYSPKIILMLAIYKSVF